MYAIPLLVISGVTVGDIAGQIIDWFKQIGQAFVDMITAPFDAVSTIFENWGTSAFGDWYGPVVMAIVLVAVLLILYSGFRILDWFLN